MSTFTINNPMSSDIRRSMGTALDNTKMHARQLSTGEKIGEAKEDPAGLAIGTGFLTDMKTLETVLTGANQAKSVLGLIDSGLRQVSEGLQDLRSLAVQANSDILGDTERAQLDVQFQENVNNINRIVDITNFNGIKLLDGSIAEGNNIVTDTQSTQATSSLTTTVADDVLDDDGEFVNANIGGTRFKLSYDSGGADATTYETSKVSQELSLSFIGATATATNDLFAIGGIHFGLDVTANEKYTGDGTSADPLILDTGQAGSTKAKAIANIINGNAADLPGAPTLDDAVINAFNGYTAEVNGDSVTITRASDTKAEFDLELVADASADISAIYIESADYDPATAATHTVGDYDDEQFIQIQYTTAKDASVYLKDIASVINGAASDSKLEQENKAILSGLTSSSSAGTGEADLTIDSKRTGAAGAFLYTQENFDKNGISVSEITKSSVYDSGKTTGALGVGNVSVTGSTGSNGYIQNPDSEKASSDWVTMTKDKLVDGASIEIAGREYALKSTVIAGATNQIQVYEGDEFQTLQDMATFFNNSDDPTLAGLDFEVQKVTNGATTEYQMKMTSKVADAGVNGESLKLYESDSDNNPDTLTLQGGKNGGVDVSRIVGNADFTGKISDFEGKMDIPGTVNLSVKIGGQTYEAAISNPNPGQDTTIRMESTDDKDGGYFKFIMPKDSGMAVNSQTDAEKFATEITAAFEGLNFYQTRDIETFNPKGSSIEDTVVDLTSMNHKDMHIENIEVQNSSRVDSGGDAAMKVTLRDGRVFENSTLGRGVSQGEKIELLNPDNSNEKMTFIMGRDVNLTEQTSVDTFKKDLLSSFQADHEAMQFQVGLKFDQTLEVSVQSVRTESLFGGEELTISTKAEAKKAGNVLSDAIDLMKSLRGEVGAVAAGLDTATDNISSSIQSLDSSRSTFLDADYPEASTNYAVNKTKIQANVALLAGTNELSQSLLQLIGR